MTRALVTWIRFSDHWRIVCWSSRKEGWIDESDEEGKTSAIFMDLSIINILPIACVLPLANALFSAIFWNIRYTDQ